MKYREKIVQLLYSRNILRAVMAVNIIGTFYGFYYYRFQLLETSGFLWVFVPDSPLSTLAVALSIFLYLREKNNSYIDTFAFFGNLKYGVWTVFVLLYMQEGFLDYQNLPLYLFLISSHALMVLQAFLVLDYSEISLKPMTIVFSWFLLNDFIDYWLGIHSSLPREAGFSSPVAWTAISLTFLGFLIVYSEKVN